MFIKAPMRKPFCPYCFEGEIIYDSDSNRYYCEHCSNDVEMKDIRKIN
jgi:ribosomal protein S27AE